VIFFLEVYLTTPLVANVTVYQKNLLFIYFILKQSIAACCVPFQEFFIEFLRKIV